jgi:hypothetical protein
MGLLGAIGAGLGEGLQAGATMLQDEIKAESALQRNMQMLMKKMEMESEQKRSDKEWELGKADEMRQKKTDAIRNSATEQERSDVSANLAEARKVYMSDPKYANDPNVIAALADADSRNDKGLLASPSLDNLAMAQAKYDSDYGKLLTLEESRARASESREDRALAREDRLAAQKDLSDYRRDSLSQRGSAGEGKAEVASQKAFTNSMRKVEDGIYKDEAIKDRQPVAKKALMQYAEHLVKTGKVNSVNEAIDEVRLFAGKYSDDKALVEEINKLKQPKESAGTEGKVGAGKTAPGKSADPPKSVDPQKGSAAAALAQKADPMTKGQYSEKIRELENQYKALMPNGPLMPVPEKSKEEIGRINAELRRLKELRTKAPAGV